MLNNCYLRYIAKWWGLSWSWLTSSLYLLSSSSPIILNLFTFFSLGILKVPWDSLVSISDCGFPCPSSSPGTPRRTSHQRRRRLCRRAVCTKQRHRPCSWTRGRGGIQPFLGQLQIHPSWSLQENSPCTLRSH